jgi:predicted Fe-S protein YdhL (DUF1289 family)
MYNNLNKIRRKKMTSDIELLTKWENLTEDEKEEVLRFVHELNEKETKSTVSNQEMSER